MNPLHLESNDEVYRYLLSLAGELKQSGRPEVSGQVTSASQFATGSPSEFLHEAMTALTSVQAECKDVLTTDQLADLKSVIEQIKTAFQRIGGA